MCTQVTLDKHACILYTPSYALSQTPVIVNLHIGHIRCHSVTQSVLNNY